MTLAEWMDRLWYMGHSTTCDLQPHEARQLLDTVVRGLLEVAGKAAEAERRLTAQALRAEGHPGSVLGKLATNFDANGSEVGGD